MFLRLASLLTFSIVLTGCMASSVSEPVRTAKGQHEAAQAYAQLGAGYLREGNMIQARAALAESLTLQKDNADALAALALVFQQEGEVRLAEQYFHRALAKRPHDARLLNNFAGFLYEQKRFDEAMVNYQQALLDPLYPERARVLENLGMTALRREQRQAARSHFEQALRLDPRLPRSLQALAKLSFEEGDYAAAKNYNDDFSAAAPHTAASLELGMRIAQMNEDHGQVAELKRQLMRLHNASLASPYHVSESR